MSAKGGPKKAEVSATTQPRPRFTPTATRPDNTDFSSSDEAGWIDVIQAPCYVSLVIWVMQSLTMNRGFSIVRYRSGECYKLHVLVSVADHLLLLFLVL
jgi:hypothetical protein